MTSENKPQDILDTVHISKALGVFLSIFGMVILLAIFFTETAIGRMTNAFAGIIITGIGAGMIIQAVVRQRRSRRDRT